MSWTRQEHEAAKTRYQAALEEMAAGSVAGLVQVARLLPDALAEIERGWAEIERYEESEGAWHEATGANGAEDALGIMRTLRARLSHAHDAANKLYQAATGILREESETQVSTLPHLVQWFRNLKNEDGGSQDIEMGCLDLEGIIAALRAALDPTEAEAAAREATRRDGLEREVERFTAELAGQSKAAIDWRGAAKRHMARAEALRPGLTEGETRAWERLTAAIVAVSNVNVDERFPELRAAFAEYRASRASRAETSPTK